MSTDVHSLDLAWLTRLRWAAIVGQLATMVAAVLALDLVLPWAPIVIIVGLEALSNGAAWAWSRSRRRVTERVIASVMVFDLIVLTALLYLSGGPTNPFNFLYLVHIALAAVVLRPRWTWALAGVSALLFALLFVDHVPMSFVGDEHAAHHHAMAGHSAKAMDVHTKGMWVAFTVAAGFIVTFTSRINRELAAREADLARARDHAVRTERLAALATMAAGAAHELSTPLSTIAVVARELERELAGRDAEGAEDARLILSEIDRCRRVLDRLAVDAGQPRGERAARVSAVGLVEMMLRGIADSAAIAVTESAAAREAELVVQREGLARALRGLVDNAVSAAGAAGVSITVDASDDAVSLCVSDSGGGVAPEILGRLGEPFVTTREPGEGMGLGVFLARSVVHDHGGSFHVDSRAGEGTRVTVTLPRAPKEVPQS